MRQMVSELGCTFVLRIFFRFSPFYHKKAMKSANFMPRYYTLEQEKIWTESEEIKRQHSVIQNLIFFPFFSGLTFQAAKF